LPDAIRRENALAAFARGAARSDPRSFEAIQPGPAGARASSRPAEQCASRQRNVRTVRRL